MKILAKDISRAFEDLLSDVRSREEIAAWANNVRAMEDKGKLLYEPSEAEMIIWEALEYLIGVDLKISPTIYLHTKDDFRIYWESIKMLI